MSFTEKKFSIPEINGISKKTIDEHLKLYAGYVKHANLIMDTIKEMSKYVDHETMGPGTAYAINEMQRRFSFEYDGIRNHEFYFENLEGGAKPMPEGTLMEQIKKDFGSEDAWISKMKTLTTTRGIGWAITYFDKVAEKLVVAWIDEQHLGHLNSAQFIYGIDMWEHSYLFDYVPADKKKYVEAYIAASNHEVCQKRFEEATK